MKKLTVPKQNLEKIAKKYNIYLILIFGSYAKGTFTDKSDLDIAILSKNKFNFKEYNDLYGKLSKIFPYNIDLTFLREADPLLMKQVVENCKTLYEDKKDRFINYRVYAYKRYMDHEKFFKIEEEYISSKLKQYAK